VIASLDACDKSDIFRDVLKSFHAKVVFFSTLAPALLYQWGSYAVTGVFA
jgi:hypothetical protein